MRVMASGNVAASRGRRCCRERGGTLDTSRGHVKDARGRPRQPMLDMEASIGERNTALHGSAPAPSAPWSTSGPRRRAGGKPGLLGELVDVASLLAQGGEQSAFILVERHLALQRDCCLASQAEILEDVGAVAHQPRPVSQERVGTLAGWREDAPGNDEDLPSLVGGKCWP